MNGAVHEVQHIPRELDLQLAASLPLGDPGDHELPTSQALHLSATEGEGGCNSGMAMAVWKCAVWRPHGLARSRSLCRLESLQP